MPEFTAQETAQAIIYWLGGSRQKDIAWAMKGQKRPSQLCTAISRFVADNGVSYEGYNWETAKRKRGAEAALNHWCRKQPEKPRFKLRLLP